MSIARRLTKDGVLTATGKPCWSQASVRRVLVNELYVGKIRRDGKLYDGVHKAIVSEGTWRSAVTIRNAAARAEGNGGGRSYNAGPHLFTRGILKCGKCVESMIPRRADRGRTGYYVCTGHRYYGNEVCSRICVRTSPRRRCGTSLSRRYLDLDAMREQFSARLASDRILATEAQAEADREAQRAGERLLRVKRAFQDGMLEPEDYRDPADPARRRAEGRAGRSEARQRPRRQARRGTTPRR